jgi:amino acid transporter
VRRARRRPRLLPVWRLTDLAVAAIGVAVIVSAVLLHGTSIKWGVRFQNAIGAFKIAIMLVIVFAGFAALGGHTRVPVVPSNFDNAFAGSRSDIYGIASCIVRTSGREL